jgi:hypothetical protein
MHLLQSLVTLAIIVMVYFSDGGLPGILLAYMVGKFTGALGLTFLPAGMTKWWQFHQPRG